MTNNIVIGLGYIARSGKDTIADYLVREYSFKKLSFAWALKEGIGRKVFGFSDDQLYGDKKETVDEFWNSHLKIYQHIYRCDGCEISETEIVPDEREPNEFTKPCGECGEWLSFDEGKLLPITPRLILQLAGTEAGRHVFGQNIWVNTVARQMNNSSHDKWVIPDVRFPNEANSILKWNGKLFRVERKIAKASGGAKLHPSETSLSKYKKWTDVIINNSTMEDLYSQVDSKIISTLRG